jgi:HAD superfamily hydrolase (TIGR01509 family)
MAAEEHAEDRGDGGAEKGAAEPASTPGETPRWAYIFDFDGVLVDTMPAHFASYREALAEFGVPIDRERFYYQAGMTGREQIRHFCERAGVAADVEAVYARKTELAAKHRELVTPIAANIELLRTLRAAGFAVAIASGSSKPSILPVMVHLHIQVDAVASSEDVKRGKPHPDLFLCAARLLGVLPGQCTVIEDSEVGVQAALAAEMRVLRFYNSR